MPRSPHAADGVAEQRVPGEHRRAPAGEASGSRRGAAARRHPGLADEEGEHARGVARRVQRTDLQVPERERLAGLDGAGRALHRLALERVNRTTRSGQRASSAPSSITWSW